MSYESPPLFLLLSSFFQDKDIDSLTKAIVKDNKVKVKDFFKFVLYAAEFFESFGNYLSFGSKKFIPELEPLKFE